MGSKCLLGDPLWGSGDSGDPTMGQWDTMPSGDFGDVVAYGGLWRAGGGPWCVMGMWGLSWGSWGQSVSLETPLWGGGDPLPFKGPWRPHYGTLETLGTPLWGSGDPGNPAPLRGTPLGDTVPLGDLWKRRGCSCRFLGVLGNVGAATSARGCFLGCQLGGKEQCCLFGVQRGLPVAPSWRSGSGPPILPAPGVARSRQ